MSKKVCRVATCYIASPGSDYKVWMNLYPKKVIICILHTPILHRWHRNYTPMLKIGWIVLTHTKFTSGRSQACRNSAQKINRIQKGKSYWKQHLKMETFAANAVATYTLRLGLQESLLQYNVRCSEVWTIHQPKCQCGRHYVGGRAFQPVENRLFCDPACDFLSSDTDEFLFLHLMRQGRIGFCGRVQIPGMLPGYPFILFGELPVCPSTFHRRRRDIWYSKCYFLDKTFQREWTSSVFWSVVKYHDIPGSNPDCG